MPHELSPWKMPGCDISVPTRRFSTRASYSEEINTGYGEGGGLNADYTTLEAAMVVSNIFGTIHLVYGTDFVFKTGGSHSLSFDFATPEIKKRALEALNTAMPDLQAA